MWFFLFVMSVAINCTISIYFACYCLLLEGFGLLYALGLLEAITFCALGWILTCTSVSIVLIQQMLMKFAGGKKCNILAKDLRLCLFVNPNFVSSLCSYDIPTCRRCINVGCWVVNYMYTNCNRETCEIVSRNGSKDYWPAWFKNSHLLFLRSMTACQ